MGGAKLSWGLSRVAAPARLTVISNTGDDETFYGLHVSPDLDTQMYTLAGLVDEERGWGLASETFHGIKMFRRYGEESWFSLGDLDLATHDHGPLLNLVHAQNAGLRRVEDRRGKQ